MFPDETVASVACRPMVEVECVAKTVDPVTEKVITTLRCTYPRYIHAEVMTHRMFSRNASSSRAIPVAKIIDQIEADPVIPLFWGSNKPGMQQGDEIDKMSAIHALGNWRTMINVAAGCARALNELGVHKQYVNRLLEPFARITTLITATDWDNFYQLRCHPMAMPEIEALARTMYDVQSTTEARTSCYHLPFLTQDDMCQLSLPEAYRVSSARCARVSYLNHDKSNPIIAKDLELAAKLLSDRHMSPFEHVAKAYLGRWANFDGWRSFRNITEGQIK